MTLEQQDLEEPRTGRYAELRQLIHKWAEYQAGWFDSLIVDRQFNIQTSEGKHNRWVILERLVKQGKLTKNNYSNKYRSIQKEATKLNWVDADTGNTIDLVFPFGIQRWVKIFPKSVLCIVAPPNHGKTAFLYNFIKDNMYHPLGIDLYNSDAGIEEVKERFSLFSEKIPNPPPFETYEQFDHFSDVIHPDHISVIDYLDMNSDVYMVGEELEQIFRKLNKGIALVAMQKKPNTTSFQNDYAIGGVFTIKKARLYLSMDRSTQMEGFSILKIVKAKSRIDPTINPNGKEFAYKLVNGTDFVNIQEITK
jgi:hypothetical protein